MSAIRVGVVGAGGRMGASVCEAIAADPLLALVAAVDPQAAGQQRAGVAVAGELRALADAHAEVVVDFTVAHAARTTLPWLAMHGMHAVVGTTGFDADDFAAFHTAFSGSNCLIASNFAISAVLMMRFAELAAPYFDTAEIIELHHDGKIDAPYPGARGSVGPGGIRLHSVRMRGMVAHQEVILGAQGQTLTIRQDSYDRSSYMPGVVLACKRIAHLPGLTLGLDAVLGV